MAGTGITDNEVAQLKQKYISQGFSEESAQKQAETELLDQSKNQGVVEQQVNQNQIAIDKIDSILTRLEDEFISSVGFTSIGLSSIPGTDSYNINKDLDTIKAIIGFSKLQEMRDASKTGGALGQISDRENQLLQSVLGSLDIGQSPEQFKQNLQAIKISLNKINEAAQVDSGTASDSPEAWYGEWNPIYEEYGI